MNYLLIALGSALGGVARYWCSSRVAGVVGEVFPWGTFAVNVIGSFLIGVLFGVLEPGSRWQFTATTREHVNSFLIVGVLGGFTTFSAFSLQTLNLLREQQWLPAGMNILLSVTVCLLAAAGGYWAALR